MIKNAVTRESICVKDPIINLHVELILINKLANDLIKCQETIRTRGVQALYRVSNHILLFSSRYSTCLGISNPNKYVVSSPQKPLKREVTKCGL